MLHIYVQSKCTFCHFNYQKYSKRGIFILKDTKVSKFIQKIKRKLRGKSQNWRKNETQRKKLKPWEYFKPRLRAFLADELLLF